MNSTDFKVFTALFLREETTKITRNQLCLLTGFSDRMVRISIHRLRNLGYRIISDSSHAGYWVGSDDDWNDFCDRERQAALSRLHRKTLENGRQLRIEVEECQTRKDTTGSN